MTLPWLDIGDDLRAHLWHRAHQPPSVPRWPLCLGPVEVGSVAPLLWERLSARGTTPQSLGLRPGDGPSGPCWQLDGDLTFTLAGLGRALRGAGLVPHWHDEELPVCDAQGRCLGAVERGIARLLGLAVHAVHLVAISPARGADGAAGGGREGATTWVQQRALAKLQDPGRWDTLMGGTVAFGETPADTLPRELWEEAGLLPGQLQGLQACGHVRVARPAPDDGGLTYWIDHIHCYGATLDARATPVNQDGEVLRFGRLTAPELAQWLQQDRFTLEAACALLQVLAQGPDRAG